MTYSDYIRLGFIRTDFNDSVEFDNTGYHGFTLEKAINEKMFVCVGSGELDTPKLYINRGDDTYVIIPLSCEAVESIFNT